MNIHKVFKIIVNVLYLYVLEQDGVVNETLIYTEQIRVFMQKNRDQQNLFSYRFESQF